MRAVGTITEATCLHLSVCVCVCMCVCTMEFRCQESGGGNRYAGSD